MNNFKQVDHPPLKIVERSVDDKSHLLSQIAERDAKRRVFGQMMPQQTNNLK